MLDMTEELGHGACYGGGLTSAAKGLADDGVPTVELSSGIQLRAATGLSGGGVSRGCRWREEKSMVEGGDDG